MDVRPATRHDAEAIAAIHVDAWRHAYRGLIADDALARRTLDLRLAHWRRELESGAQVLVATAEQAVLGWVCIGGFRQSDDARPEVRSLTRQWGEIHGLYIAPTAQRRGLGRSLLNAAHRRLEAQGFDDVGLWVLASNTAAIRFYERCGFRDLALDQNFTIDAQPLVEKLMARALGGGIRSVGGYAVAPASRAR